jgi:hypothetical protein
LQPAIKDAIPGPTDNKDRAINAPRIFILGMAMLGAMNRYLDASFLASNTFLRQQYYIIRSQGML